LSLIHSPGLNASSPQYVDSSQSLRISFSRRLHSFITWFL